MAKTPSEKAAEALLDAAGRVDWNPYIWTGYLTNGNIETQRRIARSCVIFLDAYRGKSPLDTYVKNSRLSDRDLIETSVDLTDFDE